MVTISEATLKDVRDEDRKSIIKTSELIMEGCSSAKIKVRNLIDMECYKLSYSGELTINITNILSLLMKKNIRFTQFYIEYDKEEGVYYVVIIILYCGKKPEADLVPVASSTYALSCKQQAKSTISSLMDYSDPAFGCFEELLGVIYFFDSSYIETEKRVSAQHGTPHIHMGTKDGTNLINLYQCANVLSEKYKHICIYVESTPSHAYITVSMPMASGVVSTIDILDSLVRRREYSQPLNSFNGLGRFSQSACSIGAANLGGYKPPSVTLNLHPHNVPLGNEHRPSSRLTAKKPQTFTKIGNGTLGGIPQPSASLHGNGTGYLARSHLRDQSWNGLRGSGASAAAPSLRQGYQPISIPIVPSHSIERRSDLPKRKIEKKKTGFLKRFIRVFTNDYDEDDEE